jgi:hypothetical protein
MKNLFQSYLMTPSVRSVWILLEIFLLEFPVVDIPYVSQVELGKRQCTIPSFKYSFGCGCWAENESENCVGGAISCTGTGEDIILSLLAKECFNNIKDEYIDNGIKKTLEETFQNKQNTKRQAGEKLYFLNPRLNCFENRQRFH